MTGVVEALPTSPVTANPTHPMSRNPVALSTVDAFFRAIESVDAHRIAALFAEDATLEDPIGTEVIRGRENIQASFANGLAQLIRSAEITTVFAAESAGRVAAHWRMTARAADDTEVCAEGIDIITVSVDGLIERVEGYWDANSFVAALSRTGEP
jgi:steroid Delta-isomerase